MIMMIASRDVVMMVMLVMMIMTMMMMTAMNDGDGPW